MLARLALLLGLTLLAMASACDSCKGDRPAGSVAPLSRKSTQGAEKNVAAGAVAKSGAAVESAVAVDSAHARAPRFAPLSAAPLNKEDTADCDVEADLMDKVTCLASLAQRRRDPRFCDRIEALAKTAGDKAPVLIRSGNAGSACHRTIAFVRDDPKLCVAIQQDSMAAGCLSYFAMKRHDPKICELAKGEAAASCYLNEAARTHDASLCAKTGRFAEDCSKRLGPKVVEKK